MIEFVVGMFSSLGINFNYYEGNENIDNFYCLFNIDICYFFEI